MTRNFKMDLNALKAIDLEEPRKQNQVLRYRENLIKEAGSKSEAIRRLNAEGWTRTQIADFLGLRYQHVRTVLITPLTSKAR